MAGTLETQNTKDRTRYKRDWKSQQWAQQAWAKKRESRSVSSIYDPVEDPSGERMMQRYLEGMRSKQSQGKRMPDVGFTFAIYD